MWYNTNKYSRNGDLKPVSIAEKTVKNQRASNRPIFLEVFMKTTFKEWVRTELINCAKLYNEKFLKYDYLIISNDFKLRKYYIISANSDNFKHLTGLNTHHNYSVFFKKCLKGNITTDDFNLKRKNKYKNNIKGSVRRKMHCLSTAMTIYDSCDFKIQEKMIKNKIFCSFATSNNICTIGFVSHRYAVPITLLKGDLIEQPIENFVMLRKLKCGDFFRDIICGDKKILNENREILGEIVDFDFINYQ